MVSRQKTLSTLTARTFSFDDTLGVTVDAFAIMLKWVHYCPLPKDRAIASSDTKIIPSEKNEKDARKTIDRRKDGGGTVRSARNAKTATPDAIMRRCFRFGVRSKVELDSWLHTRRFRGRRGFRRRVIFTRINGDETVASFFFRFVQRRIQDFDTFKKHIYQMFMNHLYLYSFNPLF